jgi:hypothetical protein
MGERTSRADQIGRHVGSAPPQTNRERTWAANLSVGHPKWTKNKHFCVQNGCPIEDVLITYHG